MAAAAGTGGGSATAARLPAWRDLVREHFVTLDIDADGAGPFAGSVSTSTLGHLRVSQVSSVTQGVSRTEGLLRADGARYLQLALVTRGGGLLRQDGRECALRPGDFALYETDRPFFWGLDGGRAGAWGLLVFTWPRATVPLGADESRALTARRLDGHAGLGGVVSRTLRDLAATRPEPGAAAARVADGIAELVATAAAALPGVVAPPPPGQPALAAVEAWIAGHLDDPALCPDRIAAAHYISTRQLHRLFAAAGTTVSAHIRSVRLERCRRALLGRGGEPVHEIARRHGFADPATFSRAFRAAYGTSPSRYRTP